jgi:hypothetical protein
VSSASAPFTIASARPIASAPQLNSRSLLLSPRSRSQNSLREGFDGRFVLGRRTRDQIRVSRRYERRRLIRRDQRLSGEARGSIGATRRPFRLGRRGGAHPRRTLEVTASHSCALTTGAAPRLRDFFNHASLSAIRSARSSKSGSMSIIGARAATAINTAMHASHATANHISIGTSSIATV